MNLYCAEWLAVGASGPHQGNAVMMIGIALLLGAVIQILSHRLHIPAIVPLLLAGVALGPEVAGRLLDNPGIIAPQLIPLELLKFIVGLAVAVILFEGGLGLDIKGFRKSPIMIRRLLTLGVGITWLGTAAVTWFFYKDTLGDQAPRIALLLGSLVIVTGPTVIQPILRRTNVRERLHHILLWESVLIDAIGVFIAILSLEWVLHDNISQTFMDFGGRFLLGIVFGVVGGLGLDFVLRDNRISVEHVNITTLGVAVFLFGVSDHILPESGLLTVCVAGFVVAYRAPPRLRQITQFKQELTELAVSVLFIVLAANLSFEDFRKFLDSRGIMILAIIIFVIRPISIFACSIGRPLTMGDKLFLSWMSPRGIVAASMASIFALALKGRGQNELAGLIQAFVFSVIGVTVILQGLSAGIVAHLTGVKAPPRSGWIIVGAHRLGREVATFLKDTVGVNVTLLDTNAQNIRDAHFENLEAEVMNATEKSLLDRDLSVGVGHLLALTNNPHLNKVICRTWSEIIPNEHLWRWSPEHDDLDAGQVEEGRPILSEIHNPVMLGWELDRSKARLLPVTVETRSNREQVRTLITGLKGQMVHFGEPEDVDDADIVGRMVLHRWSLDLVHLTRSEIIFRSEAGSRDDLLQLITERIAAIHPEIDREKTLTDLIHRESSFSTAIGNGVAVPHTYCDTLSESVCAICQIPDGIDFNGHDGKPVHLVFLLASPPGDPEHHLKILGEIANLASNPQLIDNLVNAPEPSDVLNLIESTQRDSGQ